MFTIIETPNKFSINIARFVISIRDKFNFEHL